MADASPPADAPAAAVADDEPPSSPATAKSLARKRQSFGQPGDALSRDDAEQAEFADLVGKRVVCLEEHKPSPDYGFLELAIEPGDELELTGQSAPDGWLHAAMEMPSGIVKEGLVPEDFVELLDPLESEPASPEPGASQHGPIDSEAAAAAAAAGGPAGAPAGADLDDDDEAVDDGTQMVLEDFLPDAAALNEVTVYKDQLVEVIGVDDQGDAPAGWTVVRVRDSGKVGLVPEDFLGDPPRLGKSEQEKALLKAEVRNKELEAKVAEMERKMEEQARDAQEEKAAALKALDEQKEAEVKRVREERAEEARMRQSLDVQSQALGRELNHVDHLEDERLTRERNEETARKARASAEAEFEASRSVYGRKLALAKAHETRREAEERYTKAEQARLQAEADLMDAQRVTAECADALKGEELAREANERTMMLLPGLQELLAPTQNELKACLETVTSAVMRNVQDSARLLASVASHGGEGPAGAHGTGMRREQEANAMMARFKSPGQSALPTPNAQQRGQPGQGGQPQRQGQQATPWSNLLSPAMMGGGTGGGGFAQPTPQGARPRSAGLLQHQQPPGGVGGGPLSARASRPMSARQSSGGASPRSFAASSGCATAGGCSFAGNAAAHQQQRVSLPAGRAPLSIQPPPSSPLASAGRPRRVGGRGGKAPPARRGVGRGGKGGRDGGGDPKKEEERRRTLEMLGEARADPASRDAERIFNQVQAAREAADGDQQQQQQQQQESNRPEGLASLDESTAAKYFQGSYRPQPGVQTLRPHPPAPASTGSAEEHRQALPTRTARVSKEASSRRASKDVQDGESFATKRSSKDTTPRQSESGSPPRAISPTGKEVAQINYIDSLAASPPAEAAAPMTSSQLGMHYMEVAREVQTAQHEGLRGLLKSAAAGVTAAQVPGELRNPIPPLTRSIRDSIAADRRLRQRKTSAADKWVKKQEAARQKHEEKSKLMDKVFSVRPTKDDQPPQQVGDAFQFSSIIPYTDIMPTLGGSTGKPGGASGGGGGPGKATRKGGLGAAMRAASPLLQPLSSMEHEPWMDARASLAKKLLSRGPAAAPAAPPR